MHTKIIIEILLFLLIIVRIGYLYGGCLFGVCLNKNEGNDNKFKNKVSGQLQQQQTIAYSHYCVTRNRNGKSMCEKLVLMGYQKNALWTDEDCRNGIISHLYYMSKQPDTETERISYLGSIQLKTDTELAILLIKQKFFKST